MTCRTCTICRICRICRTPAQVGHCSTAVEVEGREGSVSCSLALLCGASLYLLRWVHTTNHSSPPTIPQHHTNHHILPHHCTTPPHHTTTPPHHTTPQNHTTPPGHTTPNHTTPPHNTTQDRVEAWRHELASAAPWPGHPHPPWLLHQGHLLPPRLPRHRGCDGGPAPAGGGSGARQGARAEGGDGEAVRQ